MTRKPNPTARLWHLLHGASATLTFPDGVKVDMGICEAAQFVESLLKEGWELTGSTGVEKVSRG